MSYKSDPPHDPETCKELYWVCTICNEAVIKTNIATHQQDKHANTGTDVTFLCYICDGHFTASQLLNHSTTCDGTRLCETCGDNHDKTTYKTHVESCRGYWCNTCEQNIDLKVVTRDEHNGVCQGPSVLCNVCKEEILHTDLLTHAASCISNSFECDMCKQYFPKNEILTHKEDCLDIKCPKCNVLIKANKYTNHFHLCSRPVGAALPMRTSDVVMDSNDYFGIAIRDIDALPIDGEEK